MDNTDNIIGEAPALQEVLRAADMVAVTDVAVLITGETGTGKDMLARRIHQASRRNDKPFVSVNCAALPESLAESLLFGHRKGAFTDANSERSGFISEAAGGTLLLDEVGEMPEAVQAKLLRFLESGEFQPLGVVDACRADVRLIAATNSNLVDAVRQGTFRRDLYYRLNVVPLEMPPLRLRGGDLALLLKSINDRLATEHGLQAPRYTPSALGRMQNYDWPGNVRELKNFAERMLILFNGRQIDIANLPSEFRQPAGPPDAGSFRLPLNGINLEKLEIELISQALAAASGNKSHAARLLGLTRDTFLYRLKKYAL